MKVSYFWITKNLVLHYNETAIEIIGVKLEQSKNLLTQTNNMDALSFFSEITVHDEDARFRREYKNKIYEIYVRVFESEKLIVFADITERAEYENFKTELIGNITHELKNTTGNDHGLFGNHNERPEYGSCIP